jgi:hypothetical protein
LDHSLVCIIVFKREAGLLRRVACHRAGHFGPDRWLLAMKS